MLPLTLWLFEAYGQTQISPLLFKHQAFFSHHFQKRYEFVFRQFRKLRQDPPDRSGLATEQIYFSGYAGQTMLNWVCIQPSLTDNQKALAILKTENRFC